jgi:hypothetical protein
MTRVLNNTEWVAGRGVGGGAGGLGGFVRSDRSGEPVLGHRGGRKRSGAMAMAPYSRKRFPSPGLVQYSTYYIIVLVASAIS